MDREDFQKKLDELGLGDTARHAVASVSSYVAAREDRIQELIERTAGRVDERTEHRWTEVIDMLRDTLVTGVSRLAHQEPDARDDGEHGDNRDDGDDSAGSAGE